MTMPVRVIQVGLGPWGLDWARRIVPSVPGVEAVAWVDPAADARAAAVNEAIAPAERCFASLADALGAVEADALLCTAALAGHRPVIEDGLTRGLHVLDRKAVRGERRGGAAARRRRGGRRQDPACQPELSPLSGAPEGARADRDGAAR